MIDLQSAHRAAVARSTVEESAPMGLAENKQIIRAFYEAGNLGAMERCLALLADDVKWTNIGSTKYSGAYVGKEQLVSNLLGPVFGSLKTGITSTIDTIVAEDEMVVVQSRGEAQTKDGRPYNNTYCHVFRLRNGKIVEVTEYLDTALVNAVFGR
jgi:uncharacterized protein